MKHLFGSVTLLILSVTSGFAQTTDNGWRVGFGINAGVPTTKVFEYTLGGDIRVQKDISPRVALMFTTGFTHFFEKDHFDGYTQYGSPYNVIPVKVGAKYFVSDNFYVAGEAGAGLAFEQWGQSFLWSPSVGLAFKNGLDLSLKYEDYVKDANTKTVALRLAYGFDAGNLRPRKKTDGIQGLNLSAGIEGGQASGSGNEFGAWVSLNKNLTSNLEASISAGYTHYTDQYPVYENIITPTSYELSTHKTAGQVVPVKASLNLFLGNKLYIGGAAGAGFAPGVTTFMYTPTIGLRFNRLDVGLKYDKYSNRRIQDVAGFKVGYHFGK